MIRGIDVSHHQDPRAVPWSALAAAGGFAICRATYGTMRDKRFAEHVLRARDAGVPVGAYHFYRPSQPWVGQSEAFQGQLAKAGIGPNDIAPALDIEADPIPSKQPVAPAWSWPCRAFAESLSTRFGACLVYMTQREWAMMGRPAWVLEHPLWVAHYTAKAEPATPGGKPWTIWQHRVGPFDLGGPGGYFDGAGQIDQNRARSLPLITRQGMLPVRDLPDVDAGIEELLAEAERERDDRLFEDLGEQTAEAIRELADRDTEPPPEPAA